MNGRNTCATKQNSSSFDHQQILVNVTNGNPKGIASHLVVNDAWETIFLHEQQLLACHREPSFVEVVLCDILQFRAVSFNAAQSHSTVFFATHGDQTLVFTKR